MEASSLCSDLSRYHCPIFTRCRADVTPRQGSVIREMTDSEGRRSPGLSTPRGQSNYQGDEAQGHQTGSGVGKVKEVRNVSPQHVGTG